ncbi:MAG: hypothetical protein EA356_13830 [Geminicoccaceae bacterium]|nr:MAG: hypothetical protein EA356_13830 [Geminicoccaceae bacterium]
MEKIQQAIERARQQRDGHTATVVGPARAVEARATASGFDLTTAKSFSVAPRQAEASRLVTLMPDAGRADIFRMLRTQLVQRMKNVGARSVAVFSARDGEGKTLVACNLAVALARQGSGPVFLLDFDFRRPTVHEVFGLQVDHRVSGIIEGTASLGDVIQQINGLPLYLLPQGRAHPAASELIAARQARDLLKDLRDHYVDSTIVVDCSPLLLTDEPLSVQQIVDSCLLVVQQGRTRRDEVQRAAELIDEGKYVGSVMNRVREADLEEGYAYGYR